MPQHPGQPNLRVDLGEDPRVVVVAFTGGGAELMLQPFDFMALTGVLKHSRILLRDPKRSWFLYGLGGEATDFDGVLRILRGRIADLGAERVFCIGTSMGGYCALLAGHALGADYVHAFSPQTYLDAENVRRYDDKLGRSRELWRLWQHLGPGAELLDLRRVLHKPNGRTRYFVHVCSAARVDVQRARHIEDTPDLKVLRYPCSVHNVLVGMSHRGFLRTVLSPDLQDGLAERHASLFSSAEMRNRPEFDFDTIGRITAVVREVAGERMGEGSIRNCPDLVAQLALDSMDCLSIIVGLEKEFGVEIDPDAIGVEDFRTVARMLAIVWEANTASPPATGAQAAASRLE